MGGGKKDGNEYRKMPQSNRSKGEVQTRCSAGKPMKGRKRVVRKCIIHRVLRLKIFWILYILKHGE